MDPNYGISREVDDYVSFKTAKLLHQKGFHYACGSCYFPDGVLLGRESEDDDLYPRPTQAFAMKWLREVHHIDIGITFQYNDDGRIIIYQIFKDGEYKTGCESGARTYEELVDEAIWISAKTLI